MAVGLPTVVSGHKINCNLIFPNQCVENQQPTLEIESVANDDMFNQFTIITRFAEELFIPDLGQPASRVKTLNRIRN